MSFLNGAGYQLGGMDMGGYELGGYMLGGKAHKKRKTGTKKHKTGTKQHKKLTAAQEKHYKNAMARIRVSHPKLSLEKRKEMAMHEIHHKKTKSKTSTRGKKALVHRLHLGKRLNAHKKTARIGKLTATERRKLDTLLTRVGYGYDY